MSAERPPTPGPTQLGEDQPLPGGFLVGFAEQLLDRRAQLLADGRPPAAARQAAVAEAVQAFAAGAGQRGWTVTERRIASLADDTLGLEEEYRDWHGYTPALARLSAVGEVLDGERARQELPAAWLRPPDPSARSDPDQLQRHPPSRPVWTAGATGAGHGRLVVNVDRPDPTSNGTRTNRSDGHAMTPPSSPGPPAAGRVSTLDRVTLRLGVGVAVVIALCSYAVSATSLYALGRQAGYAPWQAAAVPVVADGPAIYGMFRIVSRSRRGAKGAGYGWLLVVCGTAASIGGNVAHAQPDLVAQGIAAAIPLAVLAMLEGLKGDAAEVTRLTAQATGPDPPATFPQPGHLAQATTLRPTTAIANLDNGAAATGAQRRALPAGSGPADPTPVKARLQTAYAQPRPDGQAWTARTLAEAAGCGRSSAASFLQRQRPSTAKDPR
jgi:hypothetical protein